MIPPPLPNQIAVLQQVLDRVSVAGADGGPQPLVVFGLDGTLCDNRHRTLQILDEFGEAERDPEFSEAFAELSLEQVHFLLSDTLRECGIVHAELVRDITSFWRERFYNDEYITFDQPMAGAQEYASRIHEAGGSIVYLAGRDVPAMLLGTVASLRNDGFPIATPNTSLVLKPDATMGDEAFARHVLPAIGTTGEVMGAFFATPPTCEIAKASFPSASVGLIDTWKFDLPADKGIELFNDFRI